jgi:hypothetical protein
MQASGILTRIPELGSLRGRGPIILFVEITAKAAINQVLDVTRSAFRAWPEMIGRQFTARVCFTDGAKLAAKLRSLPDLLPCSRIDRHAG